MLDQPLPLRHAVADVAGDVDHNVLLPPAPGPDPKPDPNPHPHPSPAPAEKLIAPQVIYSGVWAASTAGQYLRLNRNYADFLAVYGEMYGKNFKVGSLSSYVRDGVVYYGATFDPSPAGQFLRLNRDAAGLVGEYGLQWGKNFRLAALDSYTLNGKVFYNATWNPSTAGQYLRLDRTYDQFLAEYGGMYGQNFKLAALTSYVLGGEVRYSAVYNTGAAGQYLRLDRTADAFRAEYDQMTGNGFRLAVLDSYVRGGETYYNAAYNPGTAGHNLALDASYDGLLQEYGEQYATAKLAGLVVDKVEGLSRKKLAQEISKGLAPIVTGFAAMVASSGGKAGSDEGSRRTSADPPKRYASVWARTNLASVSKTVTAVATIAALGDRELSLDTHIAAYLPSDWTRGPNVHLITFRNLLKHRSGFRHANGNAIGWADLQAMVAGGIALSDRSRDCQGTVLPADALGCYLNQNYALLRVLLPYVNGFQEAGVADRDLATANHYLAYVNERVLKRCGIPAAQLKPDASEPTLCYPFPAGSVQGTDWGDHTRLCGSTGLHLSADEVATLLVHVFEKETVLTAAQREFMRSDPLGLGGRRDVRHGTASDHNGYLWMPTANGNAEINSLAMTFSVGVQVGLVINSRVGNGVNYTQVVLDAYRDSWVPLA